MDIIFSFIITVYPFSVVNKFEIVLFMDDFHASLTGMQKHET